MNEELNKHKEQINSLKEQMLETLESYYGKEEELKLWNPGTLWELIEDTENKLNEVVIKTIKHWESAAVINSQAVDVSLVWKNRTLDILKKK